MSAAEQGTKSQKAIRPQPELVNFGNHKVISNGQWNDGLMLQYVLERGKDDWVTVGELAKVAYHANTINRKKNVRTHLRGLFRLLMERYGEILLVEYEPPHGRAQAVKIFDKHSELDRKTIVNRIDKMRSKREHATEELDKAIQIIRALWPDDADQVFPSEQVAE